MDCCKCICKYLSLSLSFCAVFSCFATNLRGSPSNTCRLLVRTLYEMRTIKYFGKFRALPSNWQYRRKTALQVKFSLDLTRSLSIEDLQWQWVSIFTSPVFWHWTSTVACIWAGFIILRTTYQKRCLSRTALSGDLLLLSIMLMSVYI